MCKIVDAIVWLTNYCQCVFSLNIKNKKWTRSKLNVVIIRAAHFIQDWRSNTTGTNWLMTAL